MSISPEVNEAFRSAWNEVACEVHGIAQSKGWHDGGYNAGERIALMHSELSEALEALRNGVSASEHIQPFTDVSEELADVVIRIMDFSIEKHYPVGAAILAKIEFNRTREHKHGGKAF